jgi:hypothetical protein
VLPFAFWWLRPRLRARQAAFKTLFDRGAATGILTAWTSLRRGLAIFAVEDSTDYYTCNTQVEFLWSCQAH